MALLLVLVKAIVEVALMALVGQFLVGMFAWGQRGDNVVYKLFQTVASPFTWLVRKVTPRVVLDTHIPLATLFLLVFLWLFVSVSLRSTCASNPAQAVCARFQQAQR